MNKPYVLNYGKYKLTTSYVPDDMQQTNIRS